MFLGNLSTTAERQARRATKASEKSSEENVKDVDPTLRRLPEGSTPIVYTAEGGQLPRDVLLNFLDKISKMLLYEPNIADIIQESVDSQIGLHLAAVDFQRDVLANNYGIDKDFGCKYLSMLSVHYPDDLEVIEAAKSFMLTCMKSYINQLKLRSKMYKRSQLKKPGEFDPMSRNSVLEFFEGCNALMVLPETKEELKSIFLSSKKPPNQRIIEMQRNLIKLLGYNPDWGSQCLSKVTQDFASDREILMRMQYFMVGAEFACREAMFSPEEKEEFYKQVPPLMHHFPHMYIMQQRIAQHSHMQQQVPPEVRAKEIEALKKSGILNLMSSPDGRAKIQNFALRVQNSKDLAAHEIQGWDQEKELSYFNSFLDHPLLQTLSLDDPLAKMNALMELTDSDLQDAMKAALLLSKEGSDGLLTKLKEDTSSSSSSREEVVKSLHVTLSSLANLKARNPNQGHDHSHNHDHGHNHSHSHGHDHQGYNRGWDPLKPDVSHSSGNKMER